MEKIEYSKNVANVIEKAKNLWIKGSYSAIAAAALLPILTEYSQNQVNALNILASILGGIGGNLIANIVQGVYDSAKQNNGEFDFGKLTKLIETQAQENDLISQSLAKLIEESNGLSEIAKELKELPEQWNLFAENLLSQIEDIESSKIIVENLQIQQASFSKNLQESFIFELIKDYSRIIISLTDQLRLGTIDPKFEVEIQLKLSQVYISPSIKPLKANYRFSEGDKPTKIISHIINTFYTSSSNILVLLGGPGSGKSAFVDRLTNSLCLALIDENLGTQFNYPVVNIDDWDTNPVLPIRISLQDFSAKSIDKKIENGTVGILWDYICRDLKSKALDKLISPIQQILAGQINLFGNVEKSHKPCCVVFLDGLDEVPIAKRSIVEQAISDFSRRFSRSLIIVTCRTYSWILNNQDQKSVNQSFPDNYYLFEISPFTQEQVSAFIKKWYQAISLTVKRMPEDLVHYRIETLVEASKLDYLVPLAEKPLLLTLMATLHTSRGQLPHDRSTLYSECVSLLLEIWQRDKDLHIGGKSTIEGGLLEEFGLKSSDVELILRKIAFDLHKNSNKVLSVNGDNRKRDNKILADQLRNAFRPLLSNSWDKANELLGYLQRRSGLLEYVGEDSYQFPHRTFQEFLAACYLLDEPTSPDLLISLIINDPDWWSEVYSLAIGRQSSASYRFSIHLIIDTYEIAEKQGRLTHSVLSALLTAARDINLAKKQNEIDSYSSLLKKIISGYIKTSNINFSNVILYERGSIFSDAVNVINKHVFPLIMDKELGDAAAVIIGVYSDEYIVKKLQFLIHNPDLLIRKRAIHSLGRSRNVQVIGALYKVARNDQDNEVVRESVRAIASIGGRNADTALIKLLNHEDKVVIEIVISALNKSSESNPGIITWLCELIEMNKFNEYSLFNLMQVFIASCAPEAINFLLAKYLEGEETELSLQAERALIEMGPVVLPFIKKQYRETNDGLLFSLYYQIYGDHYSLDYTEAEESLEKSILDNSIDIDNDDDDDDNPINYLGEEFFYEGFEIFDEIYDEEEDDDGESLLAYSYEDYLDEFENQNSENGEGITDADKEMNEDDIY